MSLAVATCLSAITMPQKRVQQPSLRQTASAGLYPVTWPPSKKTWPYYYWAAVPPASDSELLDLSDRYWALREEALRLDRSAPGKHRAEYDAIYDKVAELDDEAFGIATRIAHLPADTPKGLTSKLRIIRLEAGFGVDTKRPKGGDKYDQTVALGLWTAIEDAERLAGRAEA